MYNQENAREPLYLTLCGAEGHDIQMLLDEGIISKTEIGTIAGTDEHKIVAVENSNEAILQLQKKFIGLRIKEAPFQNLIRGEELFSWPQGVDEVYCRARVVNLDLNAPLRAKLSDHNSVQFPIMVWIKKLCQIHAKSPKLRWTLCLTLHGEMVWPEKVNFWTQKFLVENFRREQAFVDSCRSFLGNTMVEQITTAASIDFKAFSREDQQKLIMVMVPKLIAQLVHSEGWDVHTEKNLRYGNHPNAPMVTWIVNFTWDGVSTATPDALYRKALANIFSKVGIIDTQGRIKYFN